MYTKRASKDKRKLKAAGLDAKAKSLVEVVRANPLEEDGKSYEGVVKIISMWTRYDDVR